MTYMWNMNKRYVCYIYYGHIRKHSLTSAFISSYATLNWRRIVLVWQTVTQFVIIVS